MRMRHLPLISLALMVLVAIGWQLALNHSYDEGRRVAAQRRANFPVVPVPETGPAASPAPLAESEKRLGPFSIGGRTYLVVLHRRPRVSGSSQETGNTVVAMEIRDSNEAVVYKRSFPSQPEKDGFSDAWDVTAHLMTRGNGTGLMVNYSVEAQPSAPTPEETTWWQLFGMVGGALKPFSAPIAVQGDLLDSHFDTFDFRVWAHHSSVIYPVRVDWILGKLTPEQNCESSPCELRVIPRDPGYREGSTFARLCPNAEKCEAPDRVFVKKDSKIDVLACRVPVKWKEGNVKSQESGSDSLADQGEITVPERNVWLKVRIDGKEGWLHDKQDYMSLGMIFEQ